MIDYNDPIPRIYGLQIGYVVDRDDNEGLGRVRVCIPGLIEPASNWAWPLGAPGGGSEDSGTWNIPERNAEVGIFFKCGNPNYPYYLPANWGLGEPPQASNGGDPDIKVIALKDYDVIVDTTSGAQNFKISDKSSSNDYIEFDGTTKAIKISSTSSLEITSIGEVKINGLIVTINGITAGLGQL